MKYDKQKAFPYPVLRPQCDDYKDVEFQTTVDFVLGTDTIKVCIGYALSSPEIIDEIIKGNAIYVSIVSCRDTYFRSVLSSKDTKCEAEFEKGQLRGEVKVDSYIYVNNLIADFKSSDINSEFGVGPFIFEVGHVLAQDEPQVFYIDRDLFKPITSVFELVKKDDLSDGEWTIGFEEENVQIEVSPRMKEVIDDARNSQQNRYVLLNSIYFATVMQAVQKIKESPYYEEKRWGQVILMQAHNRGIDLEKNDAYLIAERLMEYPMRLLEKYILRGKE